MRTPPASETAPEGTPKPAGGRLRFLNGCVPLSHQVAGHMYGKDKVGKWGWRGARRSPSAFARPGGGERRTPPTRLDACVGVHAAPLNLFHFPQSLATGAAGACGAICGMWVSGLQWEMAERGVSGLPREVDVDWKRRLLLVKIRNFVFTGWGSKFSPEHKVYLL